MLEGNGILYYCICLKTVGTQSSAVILNLPPTASPSLQFQPFRHFSVLNKSEKMCSNLEYTYTPNAFFALMNSNKFHMFMRYAICSSLSNVSSSFSLCYELLKI
jgi:hypothetical protein